MPADYLETKFSAQLQQGTITHDQLDDFKKRYGLYMPEAYLDVEISGGSYANESFRKDTKERKYEDALSGLITYSEFYTGTYTSKSNENIALIVDDKGTYKIVDQTTETATTLVTGTYTANENGLQMKESGVDFSSAVTYKEATLWNKFTAVLSGYFSWLGNMLHGDLGDSFLYQKPVGTVIAEHMWVSFAISLVALVLQFAIAIPMGITSATHQ